MTTHTDNWQEAAVLIPLYHNKDGKLTLLLARRTEGGMHGGQIAFPGGKREPGDTSLAETALRETAEEIGLSPANVHIVTQLPVQETRTTRFRVHPFLGYISVLPANLSRSEREIAEILHVQVSTLTRPEAEGVVWMDFATWDEPRQVPCYFAGEYPVWGLTYRILRQFLPRLLAGEWPELTERRG
ncbi:MAG: CoA pyrophosphatase [Chloroflexi bacterium]|nr:MAG: CoA pyrophosphatase [Chloroflexota bacterium]